MSQVYLHTIYYTRYICGYRCTNVFNVIRQRNCIEFALKAKPVRRYIPKHRIQYKVWWFVTSQPFEYTIFTLIMINTVTLAMKFYRQPEIYTQALDVLNMIFTAVFALEFIFKLAAFRFKVRNSTRFLDRSCDWRILSLDYRTISGTLGTFSTSS